MEAVAAEVAVEEVSEVEATVDVAVDPDSAVVIKEVASEDPEVVDTEEVSEAVDLEVASEVGPVAA